MAASEEYFEGSRPDNWHPDGLSSWNGHPAPSGLPLPMEYTASQPSLYDQDEAEPYVAELAPRTMADVTMDLYQFGMRGIVRVCSGATSLYLASVKGEPTFLAGIANPNGLKMTEGLAYTALGVYGLLRNRQIAHTIVPEKYFY